MEFFSNICRLILLLVEDTYNKYRPGSPSSGASTVVLKLTLSQCNLSLLLLNNKKKTFLVLISSSTKQNLVLMQRWKKIAFQKGVGLTDRYSVHIQC